ncbi:MAG TPA: hypothetical protein VNJ70_11540 [Thermoanaerobaculia bacterium]|nr:hypothetical protein [Thermoanaerobaculia bacterium]
MVAVPARQVLALGFLALLLPHPSCAPVAAIDGAAARSDDGARWILAWSPERFEEVLVKRPDLVEPNLTMLADAYGDPALAPQAADFHARLLRARIHRLGAAPSAAEVDALLTLFLVHPGRFGHVPELRRRIVASWPGALDAATPPPHSLRARLLREMNALPEFDYEASEKLETAWGLVPRSSADRRREPPGPFAFEDDLSRPIAASVYSLPSDLIDLAGATRLLGAVRALDARRELLVMTDQRPLPAEAAGEGGELPWEVLPTFGRLFSPWPRDPLSLVRRPDGGVLVLVRPNVQPQREEDFYLGRELVQTLPERLDRAWKGVTWGTSLIPFHNGQALLVPEAVWIDLHAVEIRALALLGMPRVPVELFGSPTGVDLYAAAVERAAAELGALYGRPVRFVHPLPSERPAAERPALMARLGGGAGHDLDALLTLLPGRKQTALVADLTAGRRLLAAAPAAEWAGFRAGYGLAPPAERLPGELTAALDTPAAAGLDTFLDLVAEHLGKQGMAVERLPLLLVPTRLLARQEELRHDVFKITWNNVVVETREGKVRAEGFASLLPAGDKRAAAAFTRAGSALDLLPPLVRSVILTGGYRCASNHLRG